MPGCGSGGHGFDPHQTPKCFNSTVVVQLTCNEQVVGSNPTGRAMITSVIAEASAMTFSLFGCYLASWFILASHCGYKGLGQTINSNIRFAFIAI